MHVQLINHACVKILTKDCGILTDPWISGSVFNNGWNLIEKNQSNTTEVLNKVNYIWLSHEHPDHFDVNFFKINASLINSKKIKVLFQKTLDKRVKNFLSSLNIYVHEIENNKCIQLTNQTTIVISKAGYYDSMLFVDDKESKILNTNDCDVPDFKFDNKTLKLFQDCDLLLTQFSYAAWKGDKSDTFARIQAAKQKLLSIKEQKKIFSPKRIMPFASFIYFCHEDNYYMNQEINTINTVHDYIKNINSHPVILKLNEIWKSDSYKLQQESINFWNKSYLNIHNNIKTSYTKSFSEKELQTIFLKYREKIFLKNSKFFIFILSKVRFLNFFNKLRFYIKDLEQFYEYDIFSGFTKISYTDNSDVIKIHSSSLYFLLKFDYGFDTLTVNGLFQTNFRNFFKLSGNFFISSYNSIGKKLSFTSIFEFSLLKKYFLLLLKIKQKYKIS